MRGLSILDVKSFNEAALILHATQTAAELSSQIHKAVRTMMSGDIVVVDWINPKTSVSLSCEYFPGGPIAPEVNALAHVLLPQQLPYWLQCSEEPHSVSDFMTRNQWTKCDFFWALRELDQDEGLCQDVPLSPSLTLMIVNMRSTFGSFAAEERIKFQCLRPHVQQVYRRLAAQGQLPPRAFVKRRVQVELDATGRRCIWSKQARELLAAHNVLVMDDDLPGSIKPWFEAQQRNLEKPLELTIGVKPLQLRRGTRTLALFLIRKPDEGGYWLVLEEKEAPSVSNNSFPSLEITDRESEVLYWVSQGKSNSEIATILGISGGTVGRHLENLYPKIGVGNRYAAGMLASSILTANGAASAAR